MQRRSLDTITPSGPQQRFEIPSAFLPLFWKEMPDGTPIRYKCWYGGRGAGRSWNFARALVAEAFTEQHLILCTREFQNTIADSVKRVIERQIAALHLEPWFRVTETNISCKLTGSEFIFKGLRRDIQGIRSLEGVTRCWVEEGQWVTGDSWLILDPTIRLQEGRARPQIWVSYNPVDEEDPTHQMFAIDDNRSPDALVRKVSYRDNPWFPEDLDRLRRRMLEQDKDAYDWVWEGMCRKISAASIFKDNYVVEGFTEPERVDRYFFGVDWGFANDPMAAVRCYIHNDELWITHEFYSIGVEIDDIPVALGGGRSERNGATYEGIPGIKDWPIRADSARPETISYVARKGLNITAADKWSGSVEDGITHLKGFRKIHIHERCVNTAQEFRLYSYKVDPKAKDRINPAPGDILPVPEDRFNHAIDAIRYSLDGYIQRRGGLGVWARL
jgi:phage terminase large subunit